MIKYPRDADDDDPRDYAMEAQMMLKGLTGILPQIEHLQALEELYEVRMIQVANYLDALKKNVLGV